MSKLYLTPAKFKKEYKLVKEVDSLALANAQLNLDTAYKNFFRDKSIGFPKFKKKTNRISYKTNNQKALYISKTRVNNNIGIDVGLKEFEICSNGYRVHNPKHLRKS